MQKGLPLQVCLASLMRMTPLVATAVLPAPLIALTVVAQLHSGGGSTSTHAVLIMCLWAKQSKQIVKFASLRWRLTKPAAAEYLMCAAQVWVLAAVSMQNVRVADSAVFNCWIRP